MPDLNHIIHHVKVHGGTEDKRSRIIKAQQSTKDLLFFADPAVNVLTYLEMILLLIIEKPGFKQSIKKETFSYQVIKV
jgi:hypothetical protein